MSQMIVIAGLVPVISLREARPCHMSRDGRDFGREDGASRLLPGHKGGEADFACSSCAGSTRASMRPLGLLNLTMDCRVEPGNDD